MGIVTVSCKVSSEINARLRNLRGQTGMLQDRLVREAIEHYLDDIDKGRITVVPIAELPTIKPS